MKRIRVKELFRQKEMYSEKEVTVCGWVRTNRSQAQFGFLNINEGGLICHKCSNVIGCDLNIENSPLSVKVKTTLVENEKESDTYRINLYCWFVLFHPTYKYSYIVFFYFYLKTTSYNHHKLSLVL